MESCPFSPFLAQSFPYHHFLPMQANAPQMVLLGRRLSPNGARVVCFSYLCFLLGPFVFFKGQL